MMEENKSDAENDNAGIIAHPPVFYIISVVIALIADKFAPLGLENSMLLKPIAIVVGIVAIIIFIAAGKMFRKDRQSVSVHTKTDNIYKTGIYAFSRNPIYLSVLLFVLAAGIYFNKPWILIMQIPLILFMNKYVIGREEAYLERKFGAEYRDYKKSVRRWI